MFPLRQFAAIGAAIVVALGAFLASAYVFQPSFIYSPAADIDAANSPGKLGLAYEVVDITAADNAHITGWFIASPNPRGTVLFLNGSAGTKASRVAWLPMFRSLGLDVLLFDYRGYGGNPGRPTEATTYADARAAWTYLTEKRNIPPSSIVLFGESLGGAVAAKLASQVTPGAVVLHSTFASLPDLAAHTYPLLPMRRITRYSYDTRGFIEKCRAPVLIVHSRDDEVIPFSHAERVFNAAPVPKELLPLSGGHNASLLYSRPEWAYQFRSFLSSTLKGFPDSQLAGRFAFHSSE